MKTLAWSVWFVSGLGHLLFATLFILRGDIISGRIEAAAFTASMAMAIGLYLLMTKWERE